MRFAVRPSLIAVWGLTLVTAASGSTFARDFEMGGDSQFPYSIMAPEPGAKGHHRAMKGPERAGPATAPSHAGLLGHEDFVSKVHRRGLVATRGSSGSVLPTALPKTQLIPPEGGGALTLPHVSHQEGPIILQGSTRPIPSLPHGPETFQDRASRCAFQSGLANVPGTLNNQYIGNCVQ
jgi:hypothetical protein